MRFAFSSFTTFLDLQTTLIHIVTSIYVNSILSGGNNTASGTFSDKFKSMIDHVHAHIDPQVHVTLQYSILIGHRREFPLHFLVHFQIRHPPKLLRHPLTLHNLLVAGHSGNVANDRSAIPPDRRLRGCLIELGEDLERAVESSYPDLRTCVVCQIS